MAATELAEPGRPLASDQFVGLAGGNARGRLSVLSGYSGHFMKIVTHLRNLLHAPSRVSSIEKSVQNLSSRLETIRTELFYELRYGGRELKEAEPAERRVVSSQKLVCGMRLNLGCGHIPLHDFVNVDMRGLPGVDIIAAIDDIPIKSGICSEVFSSHVLEHFPQEELRRKLLPYWKTLLLPGGTFRAVVPDGDAMIKHAADGSYSYADFREVLFGSQDYTGDFHFNMFTPDSLAELLKDAGFTETSILSRGRRNGRCFEFEIRATAP